MPPSMRSRPLLILCAWLRSTPVTAGGLPSPACCDAARRQLPGHGPSPARDHAGLRVQDGPSRPGHRASPLTLRELLLPCIRFAAA